MAIVCNGFASSASDTTYVEYEAQVNDMFGFISWNGSITNVTCQEYLNGNYYTSYTLISNSQCVDSRASWVMDKGTFYFNYGYVTCDTKLVMTIKTTVGTATFTQEYLIKPDYTDCYWGSDARCWLSSSVSTSNVTLYWTGARPGTNNPIWGYEVYRGTTSNINVYPTNWEHVDYIQTETSMIVSAPPPGTYYLFSVYIWGYADSESAGYQEDRWLVCETYLSYGNAPTLTTPGAPIITQNGDNYIVSWEPAIGSNGNGSVEYVVVVSNEGEPYYADTSTSITIPILNSWYDKSIPFWVHAYYAGEWDSLDGYTGIETVSGPTYFTATNHRTIKYYDGEYWVECIPYYYDGKDWVECIPYYYDGEDWVECSST